jgi:hypothetical protein
MKHFMVTGYDLLVVKFIAGYFPETPVRRQSSSLRSST